MVRVSHECPGSIQELEDSKVRIPGAREAPGRPTPNFEYLEMVGEGRQSVLVRILVGVVVIVVVLLCSDSPLPRSQQN